MDKAQSDRLDKFVWAINFIVAALFTFAGLGFKQFDVALFGWLGMMILAYAPSRRHRQ